MSRFVKIVTEDASSIAIDTPELQAKINKKGYVSGVAGGSFLDKKSGFHDAGYGLDIVDWIMEPGSDEAYRDKLAPEMVYQYGNPYHGNRAKRSIEGPQICTQAKEVDPVVIRGSDFVAVRTKWKYRTAAPGKKPGSEWEQTIVFPKGKRYFISSDTMHAVNASPAMFFRLDMPGHIKHSNGDTFSEVYLSYSGRIPASKFLKDFAPDEQNHYLRETSMPPNRFIRAYHLRDPKTGKDGPWLAGMTLNPESVYEAWCHQRGYVCMIEEIGGRPIKPGQSFGAAFIVGYFDSIDEMNQVYDQYSGHDKVEANESAWRLSTTQRPDNPTTRRLTWFQDQKFGLLMHWGAYSHWGSIESWPLVEEDKWARPDDLPAWVERGKDINRFRADYWKLPQTFNPTNFEPESWAAEARRAGMKYVVFTTKHHDGFAMFDTKQSDYKVTAADVPFHTNPRSNVVQEVFNAFRAAGFGIGAYFSKADWHHPDYWSPDAPARTRNPNYDTKKNPDKWRSFTKFVHNQIEELMAGYGKIDILWLDAGQVRPPDQDIRMDELGAMARRHQTDVLIVDRTVGGKWENYRTPEQEVPDRPLEYVWESCITMGDQWSYKPNDRYKSTHALIHLLVDVVAKGGNLLLNIGPQPDGRLPAESLQRLHEIGSWMKVNGEAIYGTRPIYPYKLGKWAFTSKGKTIYAIYLAREGQALPHELALPGLSPDISHIRLLGCESPLKWSPGAEGSMLRFPDSAGKRLGIQPAYVLAITPGAPRQKQAGLGIFEGHGDVGGVLHKGAASFAAGRYTVAGSGENMWFAKDAFHFVWKKAAGDISLAADTELIGKGKEPHRKACLMIRQSLDEDSAYIDIAVHGDGLTSLQFRESKGAPTHEVQANVSSPHRVRIEKRSRYVAMYLEDQFSGAAQRIEFTEPFYVGIGVCSHNKDLIETASFSNVELAAPPPDSPARLYSTLETQVINSTDRRVVFVSPTHIEAPNWLHDGSSLIYNSGGRIHRVAATGGTPQVLDTGFATRCNNDHGISPDGSTLAISDQSQGDRQSRIYTLPITGGTPKLITPDSPSYWHGWSPDGKTLAYCAQRNGEFDIYTIPVDGGPETRLTTAKGLDDGPEYSPDGKFIYFNSERSGRMQIWRMKPDGSDQEQVTTDEYNNWFPHPSPDGKYLVFLSYDKDVEGHPENKDVALRLMTLATGQISVLGKMFGGQGTVNVPCWSPDSRRIAFVSYHLGH